MSFRGKRPRSRLKGIHGGIADILGEDSLNKLMGMARLRRAWPDIVGPMMATRTEPIQIEHITDDGYCLWVAVDHPIMGQQIRFLRDDIRKACYKLAQISNLHKISTRMQPGAGIKPKAPKPKARHLSFAEKRRVARDVAAIKDRDLRKAAYQAHIAQIAYGNEEENR
ncbi:Protein of unknown function (DUF721) [Mariprofundus ferrinatatus]|uniref:DUF721 domain-containing protein n=1 Tax=Mariprofundus ferrinatatus TaxID=1921087 RepID=A0A2K8L2Q0_9PROT|nr:DUF721 domain-containing protein [Mariprofundus ferrinatatus]ATX81605.1 Protein of unknown function (DUF721) [Mariprofundus ferrinatatus]